VFKKFSFALVAVVLMAGSAMAEDVFSTAGLDIASISDADNTVVEANLDVDFDALEKGAGNDEAVEACFRRFGGWGGHCGYHNYCYSPCYYNYHYSYCYTPTYYCYRPVCYYTPVCYPVHYWGCY
jgi:hypothetical protein